MCKGLQVKSSLPVNFLKFWEQFPGLLERIKLRNGIEMLNIFNLKVIILNSLNSFIITH